MKILKVSGAVACGVLGCSLIGPGQAQQQSFQLAFCNISAYSNILVSLAHRQDAQRWLVDGWYPVPDHGCAVLGSFQRDTIYYFAYGQTDDGRIVIWSGSDTDQSATSQCIDRNQFFQANSGSPSCPTGQESVKFRMIKVAPNVPRITWTLTGG